MKPPTGFRLLWHIWLPESGEYLTVAVIAHPTGSRDGPLFVWPEVRQLSLFDDDERV